MFSLPSLLAATTSDDIFKSMGDTMSSDVNPAQVLAVIAAFVGLCVLVSVFKKRADRAPRNSNEVNSPTKLMRQLCKEAGLKRSEIRELKKLAALQGVENPLTLLLCPSLMQAAIAKRRAGQA
ncbi:MAG: hypothetical protein JWM57_3113 [Phycisphaerales bacterium]|nr:hypothetical protein [Phycisphaerales bacterium]